MKRKRSRNRDKQKSPVKPLSPKGRRAVFITPDLCVIRGRYCKIMRPEASKLRLWSMSRQEAVLECDTMQEIHDMSAKCATFDLKAQVLLRNLPPSVLDVPSPTDPSDTAHTPDC